MRGLPQPTGALLVLLLQLVGLPRIEPGRDLSLDLTPDTSVRVRDDFPDRLRPAG